MSNPATRKTGGGTTSPWKMGWAGWREIAQRTWKEAANDNVGLVAAGVAFYGFLALVPLLGAIVLSYGIVAEPATVMRNMTQLTSVMPTDAAKLIGEQLMNVVKTSDGKKGLGLLLALGLALFGARNGAGAIVTSLNIAYEEHEKRGFVRLNLLALAMTAAAVLVAVVGDGRDRRTRPPGGPAADAARLGGGGRQDRHLPRAGAGRSSRCGDAVPVRPVARAGGWVWLTPGSAFAAIGWLLLTIGFGIYVAHFGNYNATYGSLGAVVVLLTWLYLSCYILIFGAELNSEVERQTQPRTGVAEEPMSAAPTLGPPLCTNSLPASISRRTTTGTSAASQRRGSLPSRRGSSAQGRVGLVTSGLATVGLARIRNGRRTQGAVLLGSAGLLALLRARSNRKTE